MTTALRSALLVDFDNVFFSLRNSDAEAAKAFANDPALWLGALDSGTLIDDITGTIVPRRTLVRRCYANPSVMRFFRGAFIRAGFQIIDCPSLTGRGKNSADISMVIDAIDLIDHDTHFDEFVVLSGDADFTPLLTRLRERDRRSIIFCNAVTSSAYKAWCDGMVTEEALMALLAESTVGKPAPGADADRRSDSRARPPRRPTPAPPPATRRAEPAEAAGLRVDQDEAPPAEMADLARRVSQATGAPYLAPQIYAAIFRALAAEITESGYSFRRTVDGVMGRLAAQGIRIRPQAVAFVIKGLTIAGHPLLPSETAGSLAKAFRRQVHYLASNRDLDLSDDERLMVGAWIVGGLKSVPQAELAEERGRPSDAEVAAEAAITFEDDEPYDDGSLSGPGGAPDDLLMPSTPEPASPRDISSILARIRGS